MSATADAAPVAEVANPVAIDVSLDGGNVKLTIALAADYAATTTVIVLPPEAAETLRDSIGKALGARKIKAGFV